MKNILMCASVLGLIGCASTSPSLKPLPFPVNGESNFESFSKAAKNDIVTLQNQMNAARNDIDCAAAPTPSRTDSYTDAKAIVRIPSLAPAGLYSSGYCTLKFNVTKTGETRDIGILICTHEALARGSIRAVSRWKYEPKKINNTAYDTCGVETKITNQFTDETGAITPLPQGF